MPDSSQPIRFCTNCGHMLPAGAAFCPGCGHPAMPARPEPPRTPGASLSLRYLRCPQCGSYDVIARGQEGALGKSVATGLAFGAIGNLVANANADEKIGALPIQYQCRACKEKFVFYPQTPAPDELLEAPTVIEFTRGSSFVGAAVQQFVFLNGLRVGAVKNGGKLVFTTNVRYNTLFVTDFYGVAYKEVYRFEALPGMIVPVHFNMKFRA